MAACRAARIFFWVGVAMVVLIGFHIAAVLALRCLGREVSVVLLTVISRLLLTLLPGRTCATICSPCPINSVHQQRMAG